MKLASFHIASLPVFLTITDIGGAAICKHNNFVVVYDQPESAEKIVAHFLPDNYLVNNMKMVYNHLYQLSEMPSLKSWLIQQELSVDTCFEVREIN